MSDLTMGNLIGNYLQEQIFHCKYEKGIITCINYILAKDVYLRSYMCVYYEK